MTLAEAAESKDSLYKEAPLLVERDAANAVIDAGIQTNWNAHFVDR